MKVTINVPDFFDKEYPNWKKNLWGAVRAFFGGFFSAMAVLLIATPQDTFTSLENIKNWLVPIGVGALTGGFVGLGKFLRDIFPNSQILQKLPI